ncbi:MAG: DNA repair protein, partial [Aeromonas sp.]
GSVSDKDPYLLAREEDIRQGLLALDELLQQNSAQDLQNIKDKETDELDVLFQPKKKW